MIKGVLKVEQQGPLIITTLRSMEDETSTEQESIAMDELAELIAKSIADSAGKAGS